MPDKQVADVASNRQYNLGGLIRYANEVGMQWNGYMNLAPCCSIYYCMVDLDFYLVSC